MALQVWLPLNGNLNNHGLADVTVTNNGATVDANGKIGSCYSFDGTNDYISGSYTTSVNQSFCCWVYFIALKTGHVFDARIPSGVGYQPIYINGNSIQIGGSGGGYATFSHTWEIGKWYHVCVTHDEAVGKLYINGVLINQSTSAKGKDMGEANFTLGCRCNSTNFENVKLNDVRIYDHALSPREVAEIAKGLVLHYPLSDQYNSSNLIYNGFGEHGSDGWESTTVSTTDLPTGDSTIKATFTGGTSRDYVLVNPNNTFSVSAYLKTNGATSGTTYPSILPYDIDKKFIQTHQCADGFSNTWKTTLSQPLNPGDTVIHATNISNWTTDNNYYYHVAIFGYKDSTGFVYPDMGYTQDTPTFGTKTNKSNLNKTNNTITLNSPFTGASRPAGTVICQSTEGSTYFYPFGGVSLANIQSWTKYSANVDQPSRLRYCKYIRWFNYSGAKYAGINITDTTWESNVVYDTSGFGNNGTSVGEFELASESPRYSGCTYIKKTSNITHPRCLDNTDQEWTCCAWVKLDDTTSYQKMNNFNEGNHIRYGTTPLLYLNSGTNDYYIYGSEAVPAGTWTHVAFVFKNSTGLRNIYINGVLKNSSGPNKTSTPYGIPETVTCFPSPFAGYVSDYREYTTALTADQVKQLYEAPISLANNGTLFANEFNET